jgi:hypothetical protein
MAQDRSFWRAKRANVEIDLTRLAGREQKSPLQARLCDVINNDINGWLSEVLLATGLQSHPIRSNLPVRVSLDEFRAGQPQSVSHRLGAHATQVSKSLDRQCCVMLVSAKDSQNVWCRISVFNAVRVDAAITGTDETISDHQGGLGVLAQDCYVDSHAVSLPLRSLNRE